MWGYGRKYIFTYLLTYLEQREFSCGLLDDKLYSGLAMKYREERVDMWIIYAFFKQINSSHYAQ